MDYGRFLTTSGNITRHHKFLWFFGLLLSLDAISKALTRTIIGPTTLAPLISRMGEWQTQPEQLIGQIGQWLQSAGERLFSNAFIYLLILLLLWFMVTLSLAVIVSTTIHANDEPPIHVGIALRHAKNLLLRFIALDTLIYFPLFLVILLIMLTFAGTVIGTAFTAWQPQVTTATMLRPVLIGIICLLPLTCLLVPLSLLTVLFRTLALRQTAVHPAPIRHTIGQTWAVLKSNTTNIIVLVLLLWGIQSLVNLGVRLLTSLFYTLATTPFSTTIPAWQIAIILFESFILLIQAVTHTFTAVTWTFAYQEISEQYSVTNIQ